MPQLQAQFVLGKGLSSWAISWFGGGGYSHVDFVLPDGTLLGARSDKIGGKPPGVQIRPPNYDTWLRRTVVAKEVSAVTLDRCMGLAYSQIGKPYDKTAIWGFAAGRDWRADDSWFCSELVTWIFETAEVFPSLIIPANKIFPGESLAICNAAGFNVVAS